MVQAHGLALARAPDLAGLLVPALARDLVQAELHRLVKLLARSALHHAAAADVRSTPRPKKAQ